MSTNSAKENQQYETTGLPSPNTETRIMDCPLTGLFKFLNFIF